MPMLSALKNHLFAVEAHFDFSVVLTFAFPKSDIAHLLPEILEIDTYQGKWGFIAIAIVQTKSLRPKGFPKLLGNDFLLIGYRIFAQYINSKGKRLRGLYILKSETDQMQMKLLGNLLTHYHYTTTDVQVKQQDTELNFNSKQSSFLVQLNQSSGIVNLPTHSPFNTWKEARRFAGPLPFTFTYTADTKQMLIVEGKRENWVPQPVEVGRCYIPFFADAGLTSGKLASAFIIKDVPYEWKKGKVERWPS